MLDDPQLTTRTFTSGVASSYQCRKVNRRMSALATGKVLLQHCVNYGCHAHAGVCVGMYCTLAPTMRRQTAVWACRPAAGYIDWRIQGPMTRYSKSLPPLTWTAPMMTYTIAPIAARRKSGIRRHESMAPVMNPPSMFRNIRPK